MNEGLMGVERHEGQMTQDNRTAVEDESLRVKTENAHKELNESLNEDTNNSTYKNNVTENNEILQQQDFHHIYNHCYEEDLMYFGKLCSEFFNINMSALGKENWCNMEMVIRSYNQLTACLEQFSTYSGCYYPNRVVEQTFITIHQQYFSSCSSEDDLADAPAGVVLVATLLPILLIPFIVYIVVWKSSLRY
ncbi:receptor activity-modifying protein 1-like isoform X2 [Megalobrama amblycephala]|uniref:receptor activity-modifying protein 1-like isoform X2 n=1 Tax=Megalobrama amblycephala TaxID=75352 RepID=UPI00201420DD|nr:receptor activity-modifying protein 1-like isoform X2 [Megalobrama amblycephala]